MRSWILMALPLVPVLLWVVWNRFDEAPSAAALRFESIKPRPIADADNGWLLLAGIDAAEGSDPTALGRRRVDFSINAYRDPSSENAAVRTALFAQALPQVLPDPKPDSSAELCPLRELKQFSQIWTRYALKIRHKSFGVPAMHAFSA